MRKDINNILYRLQYGNLTRAKATDQILSLMGENGGDWRSKSLPLPLIVSTALDGFYFANCVLSAALLSE